jgi:hypothetical protein
MLVSLTGKATIHKMYCQLPYIGFIGSHMIGRFKNKVFSALELPRLFYSSIGHWRAAEKNVCVVYFRRRDLGLCRCHHICRIVQFLPRDITNNLRLAVAP